jgi:hypothetical protein
MEHYGFGPAFSLISTSYLAASVLLVFLRHRQSSPFP